MSDATSRARDPLATIRSILLEEWDPIGVSEISEARDEYDAYVPEVHQLLSRHASVSEVFEYLWRLETEHMSLRGDREKTEKIAERLAALGGDVIQPGGD